MGQSRIPVDLRNPGQVFACLGFLEAANVVCGETEGWFELSGRPCFNMASKDDQKGSPVRKVLDFLVQARIVETNDEGCQIPIEGRNASDGTEVYPSQEPDKMAHPITLQTEQFSVSLGHWIDGSDRDNFKLYAGNRSAYSIACAMIHGVKKKSTKGVKQLYESDQNELENDPLNVLCGVGGSFNFDPRGGWTSIDVGFSPNELKNVELKTRVLMSPVVEIMAAWGLENARPKLVTGRTYRYAVWGDALPPVLARAVLGCGVPPLSLLQRRFSFSLALSGKNKVISHASEEKEDA